MIRTPDRRKRESIGLSGAWEITRRHLLHKTLASALPWGGRLGLDANPVVLLLEALSERGHTGRVCSLDAEIYTLLEDQTA
jgi:hypothetical protein